MVSHLQEFTEPEEHGLPSLTGMQPYQMAVSLFETLFLDVNNPDQ
jgi:hypothetical protein